MKKICSFLPLITLISCLGCSSDIDPFYLYSDSKPLVVESDEFSIGVIGCSKSGDNYSLTVPLKIKNNSNYSKNYAVYSAKLTRESTGAVYSINYNGGTKTIESELSDQLYFYSTIPSHVSSENYKMDVRINSNLLSLYLFPIPDSMKPTFTVSYYVDGTLVHNESIKEGNKISKAFVYENPNHITYCNSWYTDSRCINSYNYGEGVTENISLYGKSKEYFKWMTTSTDQYSFVNGINTIPSDKIMVIPKTHDGKEVCISNFAIDNGEIAELYIPSTMHKIYTGNFKKMGNTKIFFEGSEEQWNSLFSFVSDKPSGNVTFGRYYN